MIHSKIPLLAAAVGAVATFGFVWFGRRARRPQLAAPPMLEPDAAAREDALRDLATEPDEAELDVFQAIEGEPESMDGVELQSLDDEALVIEEPYDAVDPESMGTEFLRRATESDVHSPDPASPPLFADVVDMAVELPVGSIDSDGSTELPAPGQTPGPEPELSPNDDELSARHDTERDRGGPSNSNG